MLEPLIPFINLPEIPISPAFDLPSIGHVEPLTVKPFGTLVAAGVYIGWHLSLRQSRRLGMSVEAMNGFFVWVMCAAFIGGHFFDVLLYHPEQITRAPRLIDALADLFFIWRSQSSFGGFMGAVLGLVVWKLVFKVKDSLPYCDTSGGTFPVGWVFGRMGCTIAHDHPGMRSDLWFAVRYPGGGRFDLGLYEMLLTVPLAITMLLLMRKPRPWGIYIGVMCTYYGPVRFALDFLRANDMRDADPRHLGLTPAQWLCSAVLGLGLYMLYRAGVAAERGEIPDYVGPATLLPPPQEPPAPPPPVVHDPAQTA